MFGNPRTYLTYTKLEPGQWPIVYSNGYNIGFMDSGKWGKIFTYLTGRYNLVY